MKGGVVESAADDITKNQMVTGKLVAESIRDYLKWTGLDMNMNETVKSPNTIVGYVTGGHVLLPNSHLSAVTTPVIKGHITLHDENPLRLLRLVRILICMWAVLREIYYAARVCLMGIWITGSMLLTSGINIRNRIRLPS